MLRFAMIQKWFMLLGAFSGIASGIYFLDRMCWVEEHLGHVIQVKRMSGESWTQLYEYDLDRRLLVYKYSDSEHRNHVIRYDPESGQQLEHRIE